jgi:hypothetical protein
MKMCVYGAQVIILPFETHKKFVNIRRKKLVD